MDGIRASCRPLEFLILVLLLLNRVVCSKRPQKLARAGSSPDPDRSKSGWNWDLLMNNTGVVAMHMAVTHHNKVVIFDQTDAGPSQYRLRKCKNRGGSRESSCYAHSVEYNIMKNTVRALHLTTDTWCSSGSFLGNGTLLQTGGNGSGSKKIRIYKPCKDNKCDWTESKREMFVRRWYSSTLYLPKENSVIVVGGQSAFSYEFIPQTSSKPYDLPFLHRTFERNSKGNNLYPFLHLSNNGLLFIFANRDSILFDYKKRKVVKKFPKIPGNGGRSYPSTGSSVILPLDHYDNYDKVEVMVCGGAARGAYTAAQRRRYLAGLRSCGRMVITGNRHKWKMENMPGPRVMSDMLMLPTGDILIINGAKRGCAGWGTASDPALEPYLYKPERAPGHRFQVIKRTKIARLYHSSAVLLPDGRILVAGGNPNNRYIMNGVAHPTELRLQSLTPDYMSPRFDHLRPKDVTVGYPRKANGVENGQVFNVSFTLGTESGNLSIVAYAPPFTTHSLSMNQRLVRLECLGLEEDGGGRDRVQASVVAPPSIYVAPPGFYMLMVVNGGVPSKSSWLRIL